MLMYLIEKNLFALYLFPVRPKVQLKTFLVAVREGFKNPRRGNFPWRGGVPPLPVNFFPLGFREPTVRGGGEGGTPPFR